MSVHSSAPVPLNVGNIVGVVNVVKIHEREQWRLLRRLFFGRFLENDLLSRDVPQVQLVIWSLAVVLVPGFLYPMKAANKFAALYYRHQPNFAPLEQAAWTDKLLFVTFAMIVVGAVTLVAGDAVFVDRRDATVLSALPVRARTIVSAKLASLFQLLTIFAVGINVIPAVLFGGVIGQYVGGIVPTIVAHLVSTTAAGAFACFALLGLQVALLLTLGERWHQRVSMVMQLLAVLTLLEMLLFLPAIMSAFHRSMRGGDWTQSWMFWLPPAWFLGLYETLRGSARPEFHALAAVAARALAIVVGFTLAGYVFGYRRHVRRMLETSGPAPGWATWRPALAGPGAKTASRRRISSAVVGAVMPHPVERAICAFVVKSLLRSRTHRLYLALYAGIGLAVAVPPLVSAMARRGGAALAQPHTAVLWMPLVIAFFVILGLRALMSIPIELGANWSVRFCEPADRRACLAGVQRAMTIIAVVPIVIFAVLTAWPFWGAGIALAHGAFVAVLALLIVELAIARLAKIPFTCSYASGSSNLKAWWPAYLIAFTVYTQTLSSIELRLLASPAAYAACLLGFGGILAALMFVRRRRASAGFELVYDEMPERVIEIIGLEGNMATYPAGTLLPTASGPGAAK